MGLLQRLFGKEQSAASGTTTDWPVPDGSDEEEYVRGCSTPAFSDQKEERTFRSDPAFQQILDPLNSKQFSAAIKAAGNLVPRFPDFDLPYKWLASAHRSTEQLQRSREVLSRGIAKARRKTLLLTDIGETEWRLGNVHQAVYWWCQALHCFASNPIDYNAYLMLSYVANGCGLSDIERRLLAKVDAMRGGQVRADPPTADQLTSFVRSKKNAAITRALQDMDSKYLHAN